MRKKMKRMRIALARLILTISTPTIVYVLVKLGDPDYCPSIGWTLGWMFIMSWTCWAVKYSELFIKLPD
jgi:hypothetical protein